MKISSDDRAATITDPRAASTGDAIVRSEENPPAMDNGQDRRRSTRRSLMLQCKLHHCSSSRFIGATTSNVSDGGALICVQRDKPIAAGDRVEVAIDWDKSPLVQQQAMLPAHVVRVTPIDHHLQAVAVAYDQPAALAVAA
ncbi:MAG: PilZ domain-containing protein [Phycisphaeraceae bacterium]|nr:MAG: PilZ domain-containing protein [Phycisphaeraceae bacterium]